MFRKPSVCALNHFAFIEMKQNIDVNSKMFTKNRIDFRISFGIHIIYKVYLGRFNVLKDRLYMTFIMKVDQQINFTFIKNVKTYVLLQRIS